MPELLSQATDVERERDGEWFSPPHFPALRIKLAGQGHPDAPYLFSQLFRELRLERGEAPETTDPELWARYYAWFIRDVADARPADEAAQDPLTVGGEPLAYSLEQARTLMRTLPRLQNDVRMAVESSALFRAKAYDLREDPVGLGNSETSSPGAATGEDGTKNG